MATHKCPGPDCTEQVPRSKLACARHWGQVSRPVQQEVYAAYRSGNFGRHIEAMQAAVEEMSA